MDVIADSFEEADAAFLVAGRKAGEVGCAGDAVGDFDQAHAAFIRREDECAVGVGDEFL